MPEAVTLMIVDTEDSRLLAECPPLSEVSAGMVAEIGQISGMIAMAVQTFRGSAEYEIARAFAGEPMRVTSIYQQK